MPVEKKNDVTALCFRVPTPLHKQCKVVSALKEESMTAFLIRAISREVKESLREGRDV